MYNEYGSASIYSKQLVVPSSLNISNIAEGSGRVVCGVAVTTAVDLRQGSNRNGIRPCTCSTKIMATVPLIIIQLYSQEALASFPGRYSSQAE